jgi:hypothetical protein
VQNIRLIDIDSRIPNLALMQLSAWHKSQGDNIGFDINNPDKIYVSCIFSKNADQARGIKTLYPDAEVILGGSGIDLHKWIHPGAQKIKPDYNLYPKMRYSLGFTTRGCIRNCPFCIVPEKEGKFQRWQHISEFYDERFKSVIVLDNNITADKDWFFENTNFILEKNLKFNAIQGLDIRILNEETTTRLKELKWDGNIHFAWDNLSDEKAVRKGIHLLKDAGLNLKQNIQFYVLTGFNTSIEDDIYRCNTLKELGTNAFVMQYRKSPYTQALARWANRKHLFWGIDFQDYQRIPTALKSRDPNIAVLT